MKMQLISLPEFHLCTLIFEKNETIRDLYTCTYIQTYYSARNFTFKTRLKYLQDTKFNNTVWTIVIHALQAKSYEKISYGHKIWKRIIKIMLHHLFSLALSNNVTKYFHFSGCTVIRIDVNVHQESKTF